MRRRILAIALVRLKLRLDACRVVAQLEPLADYAASCQRKTLARYQRVLNRLQP